MTSLVADKTQEMGATLDNDKDHLVHAFDFVEATLSIDNDLQKTPFDLDMTRSMVMIPDTDIELIFQPVLDNVNRVRTNQVKLDSDSRTTVAVFDNDAYHNLVSSTVNDQSEKHRQQC